MPPEQTLLTTDTSPTLEEELEQLKQHIFEARKEDVGELWRQYVNLYKKIYVGSDQNFSPEDLAKQIYESLGFSKEGIDQIVSKQQLDAFNIARGYPSTDPQKKAVHSAADPIMMFNGQFVHESEDININGAGIDFVFRRTYKNQVTYDGPLGFNWDHNYNLWLRVANDTIFRSTGVLREDAYIHHPTLNYWVPPGGQYGIIKENDTPESEGSFIWRVPNGDQYFYEQIIANPFLHRIKFIKDKHGNHLEFKYQEEKLRQVKINHQNRVVDFSYDEQDRINCIRDYTLSFGRQGRQWSYSYNDLGDLITVTTPTTDHYREGLTTCYEYSSTQFTGELQHNLTRIIDPAGQMYLENEYGTEQGLLSFNRVVRQRQGGGEAYFEYEDAIQEFDFDYSDVERPAHQTTMVERNGHPVHYIYNKFGNLLLREENVLQEGLPKLIQWHYRYNADGALVGVLTPDGRVTQYYYGRDDYLRRNSITDEDVITDARLTQSARMAFGNLLAVVRRGHFYDFAAMISNRDVWRNFFPDIIDAADPLDIITKFTYESDYQQMITSSDPRYTQSADPAATTPPFETLRYQETLTRFQYRPLPSGLVGNPHLFLDSVQYPVTHLPDRVALLNIIQEYPVYDSKGRLRKSIDLEGIVTELEYFGATDGKKEGYLKKKTIDPGGLNITTEYEVNDVGIATAIIHPRAVNAPAGRFRTTFDINALNQIIRTITSLPFSYETKSFYERNGQLERVERDIRNENGIPLLVLRFLNNARVRQQVLGRFVQLPEAFALPQSLPIKRLTLYDQTSS